MPRTTKPVPIEERNQHVANGAERVQACLWRGGPEGREHLRRSWPELADALVALVEELERPGLNRGLWDTPTPGWAGSHRTPAERARADGGIGGSQVYALSRRRGRQERDLLNAAEVRCDLSDGVYTRGRTGRPGGVAPAGR
jgi:hypothetical protein